MNNHTHELIELEKKYWQSMVDKDLDTALSLTDFPCLVAGVQGVHSIDREKFISMFQSHQETINEFTFLEEPSVRILTPDTAILAYKMRLRFTTDGKDSTEEVIDTSTWVRRNGHWVCAMHAEAKTNPKAQSQAA
jgi:hypothetical protein